MALYKTVTSMYTTCSSRKTPYTHAMEGHWKFLGGGRGVQHKKPNLPLGEYGYFLELHIQCRLLSHFLSYKTWNTCMTTFLVTTWGSTVVKSLLFTLFKTELYHTGATTEKSQIYKQ